MKQIRSRAFPRFVSARARVSTGVALSYLVGTAACGGVDGGGAEDREGSASELRISDADGTTSDPTTTTCISRAKGTLQATATELALGQSLTLSWSASLTKEGSSWRAATRPATTVARSSALATSLLTDVSDSFMATGATWWFASGGSGPWTYLNTSTARLSDVSLGYFDAEPRCDVSSGGTVYSGGKPNVLRVTTTGAIARAATSLRVVL